MIPTIKNRQAVLRMRGTRCFLEIFPSRFNSDLNLFIPYNANIKVLTFYSFYGYTKIMRLKTSLAFFYSYSLFPRGIIRIIKRLIQQV